MSIHKYSMRTAASLLCFLCACTAAADLMNPWDSDRARNPNPVPQCDWPDTVWTSSVYQFGKHKNDWTREFEWDRGDLWGLELAKDAKHLLIPLGRGAGKNDTALFSTTEYVPFGAISWYRADGYFDLRWRPPVSAFMRLVSTGTPGVPSTFNFRRDSTPGWKEIDFIIASRQAEPDKLSHFVSAPLFVPSDGALGPLRKLRLFGDDPELDFQLEPGTFMETNSTGKIVSIDPLTVNNTFQETWAFSWKGFDPTQKDSSYVINWLPDRIDLYGGRGDHPPLRLSYIRKEKHKDKFPWKGPFPLRIGPWEASGDWAGEVNWEKYPEPVIMRLGLVEVTGCRIKQPGRDP